jgi:hypothetical protein
MTGAATARELANSLLPHLEALANVHFLVDLNVENSESVKTLRLLEDEIFADLLRLTVKALQD